MVPQFVCIPGALGAGRKLYLRRIDYVDTLCINSSAHQHISLILPKSFSAIGTSSSPSPLLYYRLGPLRQAVLNLETYASTVLGQT